MNRLTELFMERRGLDWKSFAELNDPAHGKLADVDVACKRLAKAREAGEHVVVLPDFDMDGISAGVLGYAGLAELGFNCSLFEPDPSEGYGISPRTIDRLIAEHAGVKVSLTCDVGISAKAAVEHAVERGLEVIVTDHHVEHLETSPWDVAVAVVDPCRKDDPYPHTGICGAHVLWQVLDEYAHVYGTLHDVDQIARLRVFAGLGTISDSMPLLYENRQLVKDTLSILQMVWTCRTGWFTDSIGGHEAYRGAFKGLYETLNVWSVDMNEKGRLKEVTDIDEVFIGFYLAPMFNSCKRMNEPLSTAFDVFFSEQKRAGCAQRLFDLNMERRELVEVLMAKLVENIDEDLAPHVYIVEADGGLLGLLAGKVTNSTGLPCVVVAPDDSGGYHGSGRSPEWYRFMARAESMVDSIGGHDVAFGCRFNSLSSLANFAHFLKKDVAEVAETLKAAGQFAVDEPDLRVSTFGQSDAALDIPLISEFIADMEWFKPFGKAFPEPDIELRFDADEVVWIPLAGGKHTKAVLPYGVAMLIWNSPELLEDGGHPSGIFRARGMFSFNDFAGNRSVQFVARRWECEDDS